MIPVERWITVPLPPPTLRNARVLGAGAKERLDDDRHAQRYLGDYWFRDSLSAAVAGLKVLDDLARVHDALWINGALECDH